MWTLIWCVYASCLVISTCALRMQCDDVIAHMLLWRDDVIDIILYVQLFYQSRFNSWQLMQYVLLKLFNAGMNFAPHSWHVTSSLCMCPGQLTCATCPEISSWIVLAPSWMCIPHTAQIIPVSSLRIVTTLLVSVTFFLSWISYGGRSRPLHGVTSAWWCVCIYEYTTGNERYRTVRCLLLTGWCQCVSVWISIAAYYQSWSRRIWQAMPHNWTARTWFAHQSARCLCFAVRQ